MTWPLPVCRPLWSVHYILMKTSGKKEQTTIRKWWFVEMDGSLRWAIHREMIVHNIFVCINSLLIQNDTSTFSPRHPEAGCGEKPISILETGTRISFFQFHVRDENENIFLSISCFETSTRILFLISGFETRTRIEIKTILARIFGNYIYCLFIDWYCQNKAVHFSKFS